MIIASIDVGSNSVLLLIAKVNTNEKRIITSRTFYETPRISEGVSSAGYINESKQKLLFSVLEKFHGMIQQHKVDEVLITATKAFRVAGNALAIVSEIEQRFAWKTKIISGEDEARLTFLGTTYPFQDSTTLQGVIDIGGGSTEIVTGNKNQISFKKSFDIGIVSMTEKFFLHDPPQKSEIEVGVKYINYILTPTLPELEKIGIFHAVAGTPTTLACIKICTQTFDENRIDGYNLLISDIENIKTKLEKKSAEIIRRDYGEIVEGREDVLLAGTIILEQIMMKLGLRNISVSTRGLRFGVIYDHLQWL